VVRALVLLSEAVQKGPLPTRARGKNCFAYLPHRVFPRSLSGNRAFRDNLEHLDDKLFVLSTILQCMIGVKAKIGTGGAVGPACRVYLMLSELENLLTLPGEVAWAFLHALESLSHDVGAGFTVWMHSTTTDTTTMRGIEQRLGSRLLQEWITHRWLE